MSEYRILRVLLVPLTLIVLFFIIAPRMCARAMVVRPKEPQAVTAAPSTGTGLHLELSAPEPPQAKPSNYPEGLDAARLQYLVEIDPQFSSAKITTLVRAPKANDLVIPALTKLQYAEVQADGSVALTREGSLKLGGLTEQADGWSFQIARRAFDKVSFIDRVDDDKYRATVAWHWEPNDVGQELRVDKSEQTATADFAGGAGHWALTGWTVPPTESR